MLFTNRETEYPKAENLRYEEATNTWYNTKYEFVSVRVVADSTFNGKRLTSIVVEFPRWILAEGNTHRVFSRSYSSSRAIPTEKLLERVRTNPVIPSVWGRNKPGMQSMEVITGEEADEMLRVWLEGARHAADTAEKLEKKGKGLHKQWASRGLETYVTARGIITSSEWDNFFELRTHKDAQPEFLLLAQLVQVALSVSKPVPLLKGQWHMPFINKGEYERLSITEILKCSTARSARASYNNVDGTTVSVEKDFDTYNKLVSSRPLHASPAEHQAQAWPYRWWAFWDRFPRSNFDPNFRQYRKFLETGRKVQE